MSITTGGELTIAVDLHNRLFVWTGVSRDLPLGRDWFILSELKFKEVTVGKQEVFGVLLDGSVFVVQGNCCCVTSEH